MAPRPAPATWRRTRCPGAYRDVSGGAVMHPLGADRAHDVIGRVELGQVADVR